MSKKTGTLRALPQIKSLADLEEFVAVRIPCQDAPQGYVPPNGWHTIQVGCVLFADTVDPSSLRIWARLFEQYAANRKGTLFWKEVIHLDREKREIIAKFCIDHRKP